jgi:hypothetical protein
MTRLRRTFLGWTVACALAGVASTASAAQTASKPAKAKPSITSRQAFEIGTEAYLYGYPLLMMDLTRQVMTNVREPEGTRAPMGQFAKVRALPLASSKDARVPNADTLATMLWLDVTREPWVLSLPDMKDRYGLFTLVDGWNTVFGALGKRTTGTGAQKCVITGPGWKGKLPKGLPRYESPTGLVWLMGRIYCDGTSEDYAAVHALQDQFTASPLNPFTKSNAPPVAQVNPSVDMQKSVTEQINGLSIGAYFNRLALLMRDNPPTPEDRPLLKKMARLGIVPGRPFDIGALDASSIQVLEFVPPTAHEQMREWLKLDPKGKGVDWHFKDGWKWTLKTGTYGTDYLQRALIATIALGANLPQDMLLAASVVDASGEAYSGNFRYVMHFPPGQAPSANAFWSLTMYDADYFFVNNPLSRCSLNARDQFKFNLDGSLDIYIQQHPPAADRQANWLPSPEGKFVLMLRFYWPKEALLKGTWKIPPVKPAG